MNKQSKNVSQSTNRAEIVLAIQELNPNVDISLGDPRFVVSNRLFYCSVPAEKLILPEGFYYNEKNGITNKHNTESGIYASLKAQSIPQGEDIRLLPKQVKDVSQSTNIYEIAKVIQELNPYADIRVGNPNYDSQAMSRFYSSFPIDALILPNGFYYNEKNGITNKHNTDNGLYCSLDVEDLSMANENTLMPKVDTIVKREVPNSEQEKQNVKDIIISAIQKIKNKIMGKGDSNAKSR